MKFAPNKLYIEQYTKCANCGMLIYDRERAQSIDMNGRLFCSAWCVDWYEKRERRLQQTPAVTPA